MIRLLKFIFAAILFMSSTVHAQAVPSDSSTTTYHHVQADGITIFYREAGPKDAPTIVLLHGFPTSSRQYEKLIPLLATRYHVIAPDFPGFGLSDAPPPARYAYTFDHLTQTTAALLDKLGVGSYTLYIHDYGAPVGFRLMMAQPARLHALIAQHGNAYTEGLGVRRSAEHTSELQSLMHNSYAVFCLQQNKQ